MDLQLTKNIALKTIEQLKPHCERLAIAGSIRREKAQVKERERMRKCPKCGNTDILTIIRVGKELCMCDSCHCVFNDQVLTSGKPLRKCNEKR